MSALVPAEIQALARVIDELDYYQILEISREASSSELKRAYYSSSRRFHPDANRHLEDGLREALERIAKRLTEAYSVVRDPRRRRAYDQRLQQGDGALRMQLTEAAADVQKTADERTGKTANGRRFFLLALQEAERGDTASAIRNLQMARTFEPGNPTFKEKLEQLRQQLS